MQCESKDRVSLFDHTSDVAVALAADADSTFRSQWTTRDAAAHLAVRSHLPSTERAHFSQYKTARTLYDTVVARYSSPATAALSRLKLPYLFPDLAAFAMVADLITHLRTSDTRYRAALPAEFYAAKPPPMYITLYYLVTRLPDSLRSVREHFLSLCPTMLTVDLLKERLLAAEKSIVAVGASRGDPPAPFFEGRSELRLLLVGGAAVAGARGARVLEGMAGAAVVAVEAVEGVGVEVGVVAGVGASVAVVEVEAAKAAAVGVEVAAAAAEAVGVAAAVVLVGVALCSGEALAVASASSSSALVRPCHPSSFVSGTLGVGGLGFPDTTEIPRWGDLLKSRVAIFDLDYDAILAAMYAVSISAEGDCYLCVPPDPGIEAAAPGASESALSGTALAQVMHTFTLDLGASRSVFRDCITLSPFSRPLAISLADPSGGPVLAHSSTVLPCPAVPSGSLSGLHHPSFSTNLVSGADLQDAWVDQFTPGGQRVATSGQVFAALSRSGPESAPCSCRLLSHQTLLWHHHLGHPSLPRLRGMASRVLVSGLPRSLPPFPPGPAPTCVPCVEGRQRAAPHSSEFPPTEAPLQTLHMDVWGPTHVRGQGHEHYFLLVVDDYSRYTTVFPLRRKGEVTEVMIDWIRAARRQLSKSFGSDLPVLRLHSDRGGEFSSDLLRAFCRAEGIHQTFTLPASPQQNGIAERRIGMVMDDARTSMIHAAAPHFLWPFAVQYAAHQINLQPRVSVPETTPTLRWTGKVGDASAFRVWGSRAFLRDLSVDKLSSRAVPCVFLGFVPDAPGWQFYHPASRCVLSSKDVTFDESVPYYRLFPYPTAPLPPPPLFLAPGPPLVDPLPPQGPAPLGVSQVDAVEPVEVAVDSGAARGAEPAGAGSGGAEPERAEPGGAEFGGAESGGAEPGVAESGGAEPEGAEPTRVESGGAALGGPSGPTAVGATRGSGATGPGAARTGGTGAAGPGGAAKAGAAGGAGAGGTTGPSATRGANPGAAGGAEASCVPAGAGAPRGAGAGGVGAGGARAGGAAGAGAPGGAGVGATGAAGGAGGAGGATRVGADAGGAGAVPASSGGAARPRPYFVPLLDQLQPASPLPAPPYTGPTGGLTERREPESRPASPVRAARTSRRGSRQCPPPIPGTHQMALRPSTAPQRVPLPSPPESSLPTVPDPEFDSLRAASPTVTRLLATVVVDPSFESTAVFALVAELADFAAHCRLDYATSLVAESASVCPPSVGGECALSTDVLEDRQEGFQCFAAALPHLVSMLLAPEGDPDAPDIPTPRSYAEAIEGPNSSLWKTAMVAEMASWKSTGTYVDEVPPPGANIVNGMWILRVKRLLGSPPVFKARYVARGFSQRQGFDYFHTFSPTLKMTTLRVPLHVAAQHDYELHSLDFSTAFLS
ncbi:unnamed protein product [Closterium sp. NIES-53]